ncbi:pentapeptide repeat-containing protein [bacterium]|nr:pentapeptide repeat-containing protein [bacterium]
MGTIIPINWFLWIVPSVILVLDIEFLIYLQRLWEGLADLPAILPDGSKLSCRIYPWLPTGLLRLCVPRLCVIRPALSTLQGVMSVIVLWIVVPVTLYLFWMRGLPNHNWRMSALYLTLFAASVVIGLGFYRLAVSTLSNGESAERPLRHLLIGRETYGLAALFIGIVALFGVISYGAINGVPLKDEPECPQPPIHCRLRWFDPCKLVPRICPYLRLRTHANFFRVDVSSKPDGFDGTNVNAVNGAQLAGRDLRFVDAQYAFLVKAQMTNADLTGGSLENADLRRADMTLAILQYANLETSDMSSSVLNNTWLEHSCLHRANLQRADLSEAHLQYAVLEDADMRNAIVNDADLLGAKLTGAVLGGAHFDGANLRGAELVDAHMRAGIVQVFDVHNLEWKTVQQTDAYGLTPEQLESAIIGEDTQLPTYLRVTISAGKLHIYWKERKSGG